MPPIHSKIGSASAGPFTITESVYSAGTTQPRHAHAGSSITLVLAGSLEETVARSHEYAHSLSMVVKPLDTEHANRFGAGGARTLQIGVPAAPVIGEHALGDWRWHHGGHAVRACLHVLNCFRSRADDDAEAAVFDLIAAIRNEPVATVNPPHWLVQAREHIDDVLPATIRVRDVARQASVHPVYLARQFRRYIGCSVIEYIAGRRLQFAARMLADSNASLATAAFRAGYADQSHLTRAFRARTGLTPRGWRDVVAGQVASVQDTPAPR